MKAMTMNNPMTVDQAAQLAIARLQAGRADEAVGICQQVLAVMPNDPGMLYLLGTIYENISQPQRAIEYYQRVLSLYPNHADAFFAMGNALRVMGRFEEAIENYRHSLRLMP